MEELPDHGQPIRSRHATTDDASWLGAGTRPPHPYPPLPLFHSAPRNSSHCLQPLCSPAQHGRPHRLLRGCLQGADCPGLRPETQGERDGAREIAVKAAGGAGLLPLARRCRLQCEPPTPPQPQACVSALAISTETHGRAQQSDGYSCNALGPSLSQAAVAVLPRLATAVGAAAVLLTATPAFAGDLTLGQQVFDNK